VNAGAEINYRQVIARAIADAMTEDPKVILIGEDVGAAGGAFKTTAGLFEEFGPQRVRDTPISEQAIVGAALGAAMTGLRPIAEIMFADFAGVCFDQIANQVAKYRYMTAGQVTVPLTIRMSNGAGGGFGAQHSQSTENWFLNIPGIKIAVPGTVEDLYGLTRSAVREDNPVIVFEHKNLFALKGFVPTGPDAIVPLGKAAVVREGGDITVVATQQMRHRAVEAAEQLASEGIEAAVIDPRTLVPFDDETVLTSLAATSRLAVVQEGPQGGSWGASLVARMMTGHFELFDSPPLLISSDETPIPYAAALEAAWLPSVDRIVSEIRKACAY
jgi:acetoin:2,6-dichlorophenolindophenol oxidoreductase subunit beta